MQTNRTSSFATDDKAAARGTTPKNNLDSEYLVRDNIEAINLPQLNTAVDEIGTRGSRSGLFKIAPP